MTDPLQHAHRQRPQAGWWPNGQQAQLLRACFLEGEQAVAAWQSWRMTNDLSDSDADARSLLPLLYQNLSRQGVSDPAMAKLKGVYQHTWTGNVSVLQRLMPLLADLQRAGIDSVLLKGAALPYVAYLQPGLRSNDDFGLLVQPEQRAALFESLAQHGYQPIRDVPPSRLTLMHRLEFRHPQGSRLAIYWHILWEGIYSGAGEAYRDALVPMELNGLAAQTLSATDHLLQICVDGLWARPQPSLRWIADALTLLRASPSVDWDRLLVQAQQYYVTLMLAQCLTCLADVVDADVPPSVMAQFTSLYVPRLERLEYRVKSQPRTTRSGLTGLVLNVIRLHLGQAGSRPGLAQFLQQWWGLASYRQLPSGMARAVRREVRQLRSRGTT